MSSHQPSYLPYPGLFSKILRSDIFVIADHLQFHKEQKRNLIYTQQGQKQLSLPVSASLKTIISEVKLADARIIGKHWTVIHDSYCKYPYYKDVAPILATIYQGRYDKLETLCTDILLAILKMLRYAGSICRSSSLKLNDKKNRMIVDICKKLGCNTYISGLGAKAYIDEAVFVESNINLVFNEYKPIKYNTPHGPSIDNLSVIDALFAVGPDRLKELLTISK